MKTITAILFALTLTVSSFAQSTTTQGAAAGAVVGALIGGHNHNNVAQGAIAGALIGGLLGHAVEEQNQQQVVVIQSPPAPVCVVPAPEAYVRYVYGPLDPYGYPTCVYIQQWNGQVWVESVIPYVEFSGWYYRTWRRPYVWSHHEYHSHYREGYRHDEHRRR